jgi:glutamyl-tRNA synthetase
MNAIITRFAPSPTGNLHIGGVRTALINFVVTEQAKKKNLDSKFLLRIEDTDIKRSSNKFKDNIIKALDWLGINFDNEIYIQSKQIKRHKEIAYELLDKKKAFKCICTKEELEKKRNLNQKNKKNIKRLCDTCENDPKIQSLERDYVIRIKIPNTNKTSINDLVQGKVITDNKEIDNFILLRNDGSPTYMLSVVVDDFDMGVNLIIRGDDHLNNAFRQFFIYKNMNWPIPKYAHIPLIHGEDGKKLSKRHGSVDVNEFKELGYLKESIINNLILLGWSPSNSNEILKMDRIIDLFDLSKMSKSSSIFSYVKLNFLNNHFIKEDNNFNNLYDYSKNNIVLKNYIEEDKNKFNRLILIYKDNISFYKNLEYICFSYFDKEFITKKNILLNNYFNNLINEFLIILKNIDIWDKNILEKEIDYFIKIKKIKFKLFGKPLRILLLNQENGPSIRDILYILGKKNTIVRIKNYIRKI